MKPPARYHPEYYDQRHYDQGGRALLIWAVAIFVLMASGIECAKASQNGVWEGGKFNGRFQWEKTHQTPPQPSVQRTR